jgi:hypothetical protein
MLDALRKNLRKLQDNPIHIPIKMDEEGYLDRGTELLERKKGGLTNTI